MGWTAGGSPRGRAGVKRSEGDKKQELSLIHFGPRRWCSLQWDLLLK